jgi:nitric oxide reductase NorQ protein
MTGVPGIPGDIATKLVATGNKARGLKDHGLDEVTSTRALVYAANLIVAGLPAVEACRAAMVNPMTDDIELSAALSEIISAHFD